MVFLKESEISKSVHDISSKTTSSNMTFRRIRHLVEKAFFFFFFQSATFCRILFFFFFFMHDILSKLFLFIFVVPNDIIFTVNHLHS